MKKNRLKKTFKNQFLFFFVIVLFILDLGYSQESKTDSTPSPEEKIIKKIEIKGLVSVKEEEVLKSIKSKTDQPLNQDNIRKDQQNIYDLGYFSDDISVETEPFSGGIKLIFVLKENPKVNDIKFIGNKKFKAKSLLATIPQKKGVYFDSKNLFKIRESIIEKYRTSGFYNIQVSTETSQVADGKIDLTVTIDEGERIYIKDLKFKGNKTFLSLVLRTKVESIGSWFFIKNYFSKDAFEDDIKKISYFYQGKGFFDVEVKKGDIKYNEDKGWIIPVIEIKEGKRYKIDKIDVVNFSIFNKEEIVAKFKYLHGKNFNAKKLSKSLDNIKNMYGDEGYIYADLKFDYTKNQDKGLVDIIISINENQRIYIGAIKLRKEKVEYDDLNFFEKFYIKVAPPVKEEVLRKEVVLKPGDVYRTYKEARTIQNLNNLGFLTNVIIDKGLTEEEDVRDVIVNYKEEDRGRAILSVGYGEIDGFFVSAEYNEPNIGGEANELNIKGLLGTEHNQASINYYDRYFGDSKDSLQYSAYYDEYYFSYFTDKIIGASAEYGHPISDHVKLYIRQRLEYVYFEDMDDDIDDEPDDYWLTATRIRLAEDTRDNIKWPTKGHYQSAGLEGGYADGVLAKFTGRYSHYWNFYKSLIFASNAELGLMPYDSEKVGYNERFFMGGADDMRGFAPRRAGPTDSGEDSMPKGGSTKMLLQNELRFPIIEPFKGVIFLDTGMLEDKFVEFGKPRMSTGAGLRVDMKRFYIHIDFAQALMKRKHDKTQFFHFKVGSKF